MKAKTKTADNAQLSLTKFELEQIYLALQGCDNNANVPPAVVLYCRTIKKKALSLLQEFETELKALMEEYQVPQKELGDGAISFETKGMKNAEQIDGLVAEFQNQTFEIDNLNMLTQTEFIKHTRGLSEPQMDVLEKYLVKSEK